MVVRNNNLGALDVVEHVGWDQLPAGIVAVGVVGLENTETILDSETWRNNQKAAGKMRAAWAANGIDGLPCDQHGHDRGLARTGRQLQG